MENGGVLSRLRRAVNKVKFLLNFNVNRWRLASVIGRSSSKKLRRLSFNDRPGLRAYCTDDHTDSEDYYSAGSSRELHRAVSFSPRGIQRTESNSPSDQDDVDKRADAFIANFYRQLQIERQISLELQYCRGNSFKAISP